MKNLIHGVLCAAVLCSIAGADESASVQVASVQVASKDGVWPSVAVRYASAASSAGTEGAAEVPDFQRHVTPLLGKLGCNGRACHGSFQGRGGFRLSLFGYDFKTDHDEMYGRIDPETPSESLVLQKPLMQIPHEGGRRLNEGSWEHHLLLSWIQQGAPERSSTPAKLLALNVTPQEIQFREDGQQAQLKAVAVWSDGTQEDVTTLCRFQTNDDQVADVSAEGLISAGSPGDTHVVIFYDSAVIPVPILRPVSDKVGDQYPDTPTPTTVDQLVVQKLRKIGVVQSDLCSDEEFLRRASLDVTGTLPTPTEIKAFVADTSSDKRSRKIDELLERPGYVAWWTTQLCDFTGNSDDQLNNVTPVQNQASRQWYDWIFARVQNNTPYDDLVEGMVMAVSRDPGESYEQYCENMSALYHKNSDATYADRTFMPHYWSRNNFRTSEDRVIGFAYTFLGTRIQCAQCHKHPFDQWTQDDFQQFEGFFKCTQGQTQNPRPDARDQYAAMVKNLEGLQGLRGNDFRREAARIMQKENAVVPFGEVYAIEKPAAAPRKGKNTKPARQNTGSRPAKARLLGGEVIDLNQHADIREPLMAWLRSPENPLFARAFVNRVWASYFNRGIVHPSDDLNLANPPSNAALLDYLANGFIENDFDMKWVHRTILNSRTYQLSWAPNDTNRLDEKNFARAVPRRLPAEVVWDMMAQAVSNTQDNAQFANSLNGRAVAIPGAGLRRNQNNSASYALTVFGRSIRESNCDCDRSSEPSLLQTIFVRNDGQLQAMINHRSGWLAEVARANKLGFSPSGSDPQTDAAQRQKQQAEKRFQDRLNAIRKNLKEAEADNNKKNIARLQSQLKVVRQQAAAAGVLSETDAAPKPNQTGTTTSAKVSVPDSWNTAELIREAYLRTVSRMPETSEMEIAQQFIEQASDPLDGLRSVLWALLNTKEFIVNH